MFQTRNMSLEVQLNIGNVFFSLKKSIGNVLGNPPQCLSYDDTLF